MRDNGNGEFVKRGKRRPAFGNGKSGRSVDLGENRKTDRNTEHETVGVVSSDGFPSRMALGVATLVLGVLTLLALLFAAK